MTANKELTIQAFHLEENIDIRRCREQIPQRVISETKSDLFYEFSVDKYVYLFNYGVIVLYNFTEKESATIFEQLFPEKNMARLPHDEFGLVKSADEEIRVEFNHIFLKHVSQETIKIIMLNVAQSVALIYYDHVSQDLLAKVRLFTSQMEEEGRLKISRKSIMKFIGKALNTKNKIAENLYIFDAPPVTWNDEYLNLLNLTLSRHFDLGQRHRSIDNTFSVVEANLDTFLELYHQKESSKLEWIIIILILVEVIDTFLMKVL